MPAALRRVVTRGPRPRLRLLALVAGVLVLLGGGATLGYQQLRDSSLFAVHDVVVSGADPQLRAQVEQAARASGGGRGLLALDAGRIARAIEVDVPGVHAARVDRDFPSTLRVRVWPEHAVALAVHGHRRVVVSATGRVLRTIDNRAKPPNLPRVPLRGDAPRPGDRIADAQVLAQLHAIDAIPRGFHGKVGWSKADPDHGLELQLSWPKLWIRLGPAVDLQQKLRAAELVLQAYPTVATRQGLSYVDVSAPARPAVMPTTGDQATIALGQAAKDSATTGDTASTAGSPSDTSNAATASASANP